MQIVRPSAETPTAIIVPCYNEAERLNVVAVRQFLERSRDVSLLFIDDGSRDDTATKLSDLSRVHPNRVRAFQLARNCGKAEAVRRGMLTAAGLGFEFIGFWDADLATPFETIPHFVDVLNRHPAAQIVWGTRLPLLGHCIERDWNRRLLGRLFSKSAALAVGVPIRDALCGAKLFRNGPFFDSLLGQPFSSRWIFDVEILARLKQAVSRQRSLPLENTLFEFPLEAWYEVPGSKVRLKDFVRAAFELSSLGLRYRLGLTPAVASVATQVAVLDISAPQVSDQTRRAA
ncbi:MAG: glycosyltransferase [Planctomycetaceae bacterium]